jgi:hypothetical protein
MNDTVNSQLQTYRRMHEFCGSRSSEFAPASLATHLFTDLSASVTDLTNLAAAQTSGDGAARAGTQLRLDARDDLRGRLKAMNRTANAIAIEVPGLNNKFRIPRGDNDEELMAAARAAAADAPAFSSHFMAHEMPATFIDDLKTSIANFGKAMNEQSSAIGDRVGSRAGLEKVLDNLMIIRRKLDPIMRNKYVDDPATLAERERASHIERPAKKKKKAEPAEPSPMTSK